MTRGLYPPESLSDDDIQTLRTLRREIFENAMVGGFFGASSGVLLHTAGQWARKLNYTKATFNRNTLMLSVLGSGALGMFLFATSTGKQEVYKLHPIFQVGAMPKGELDYSKRLQKAKELDSLDNNTDLDVQKLEQVRVFRRQTMKDTLQNHRGLSDSHGGHWYQQEEKPLDMDELKGNRLVRKQTVRDALQNHRGLSDSHGGRWYREEK